jgi:hypothetical protein
MIERRSKQNKRHINYKRRRLEDKRERERESERGMRTIEGRLKDFRQSKSSRKKKQVLCLHLNLHSKLIFNILFRFDLDSMTTFAQLPSQNRFGRWTLTLIRLRASDQGRYSCRIVNRNRSVQIDFDVQVEPSSNNRTGSRPATDSSDPIDTFDLPVKQLPLDSGLRMNDTFARIGQEARLLCRSTWPNPQPHFLVIDRFFF